MNGRRVLIGLGLPAAVVALAAVPLILYGDQLPDPVASHFDASGAPDGSMSLTSFVLVSLLILIGPGLLMVIIAAANSARMDRAVAPFLVGLGGFLAVLGAGILAETAVTQRGLESWTEAEGVFLGVGVVLLLSAAVAGLATWLAIGLPYNETSTLFAADADGEVPRLTIAEGERAVFTETITMGWMLWLIIGLAGTVVAVVFVAPWPVALLVGLSLIPALLLTAFRVQADRSGLTVRSVVFGIPFARIDADEVVEATVIDVEPMKWGGWGYRGSLKVLGRAAVVTRRGPGVHLKLTGDRVLVVTLDNPTSAAALLNANVA